VRGVVAAKVQNMSSAPDAPWVFSGEALLAHLHRPKRRKGLTPLPHGFRQLPGPMIAVVQNVVESPVGPFVSFSLGEPVRLGLRIGYFFGLSAVSNADARRLGQSQWGFPYELGALTWDRDGDRRRFEWRERDMRIEATVAKGPFPLLLPVRNLQRRSDGPVVVPTRMRSLARRAEVELQLEEDDPLAGLTGVHRGLALSGMVVHRRPARRPLGVLSTFRAPLRAPEPGVAGMSGWRPGRALGMRRSHYNLPSSLRATRGS
jgi:hypothetical protein